VGRKICWVLGCEDGDALYRAQEAAKDRVEDYEVYFEHVDIRASLYELLLRLIFVPKDGIDYPNFLMAAIGSILVAAMQAAEPTKE